MKQQQSNLTCLTVMAIRRLKTTELYVWVTQKGSTTPVDSVEIISATDTNDVATTNIVDIKKCGWN